MLRRLFYLPLINGLVRGIIYSIYGKEVPKKFRIPVNGQLSYTLSNGEKFLLETNETCFVTQEIFWNGGYTGYEYTRIFLKLIARCNVFLDVGAQLGYYSILGKKVNPNLEVHLFEPGKGPLHYLLQNIAKNGLENKLNLHEVALSGQEGSITFYQNYNPKYPYVKYPLRGGNNTQRPSMDSHEQFEVKSLTLDTFVERQGLTEVSLIKMDTEGTEYEILSKGLETIKRFRPLFITEMLPKNLELSERILELFRPFDYRFFYHENDYLHGIDLSKAQPFEFMNKGINDVFLIPGDKLELVKDLMYELEK